MSIFAIFQVNEGQLRNQLEELRDQFLSARIDVEVVERVIVTSGEVSTPQDRHLILQHLRALNPGRTAVVGGALRARRSSSGASGSFPRVPMPASLRTTKRIYRVPFGETLPRVAERFYGTRDAVPFLADANGELLEGVEKLVPGWILDVPEVLTYYPQPGESLESVAELLVGGASQLPLLRHINAGVLDPSGALVHGQPITLPLRVD